jgi:hypothetical protein
MDELAESIQSCISAAQEVVDGLAMDQASAGRMASGDAGKWQWIERQIGTLLSKLLALQADIGAGLGLAEIGFDDTQDMGDWIGDVRSQIAHLRAQQLALAQGLLR